MEAAEDEGYTALMFSAQNGHDACLRQLLAAKVRVRALRARVGRSAARCLYGRVRVLLGASALVCRTRDAGLCRRVCVCVCMRARVKARSRGAGGGVVRR